MDERTVHDTQGRRARRDRYRRIRRADSNFNLTYGDACGHVERSRAESIALTARPRDEQRSVSFVMNWRARLRERMEDYGEF